MIFRRSQSLDLFVAADGLIASRLTPTGVAVNHATSGNSFKKSSIEVVNVSPYHLAHISRPRDHSHVGTQASSDRTGLDPDRQHHGPGR
ncbi:hypothetical protein EMIT0232MI5_40439 [Pseudomonas sp. IT-232MI5]